jgi:small subunit ribosomal protein S16
MVKIRLTRGGAKKQPHFRIVAIDERSKRDGRPLEFLGSYQPTSSPERFEIDVDRFDAWIAKGAQPSDTVRSLVERARKRAAAAS